MSLPRSPNDSQPTKLPAGFSCVSIVEHPGVVRVRLSGELDLATVSELAAALSSAAQDAEAVIVDLSELTFMDSTGLHAILTANARLGESHCRLVLIPGPRQVQRTFEITGVADRLEFVPDAGSVGGSQP